MFSFTRYLRENNKARVFFYDDFTMISVYEYFTTKRFSIYKKKPEGRHLHQNNCYQFEIAFETDQNCSGGSALPSGFLKLLISFFFCASLKTRTLLIIEVITRPAFFNFVVKSSFVNEVITRTAFFNFVVKSSLINEEITRPAFFNFVVNSSLVDEKITRPVLFYEDFTRKICKSL